VQSLDFFLPTPIELVADLDIEEIGIAMLAFFQQLADPPTTQEFHDHCNRNNFVLSLTRRYSRNVHQPLIEAYAWLEHQGLLTPSPEHPDAALIPSRRARKLKSRVSFEAWKRADQLPRALVHPTVLTKASGPFLNGDYETAVFVAFKEVEVAVRDAGRFGTTDFGIDLMRKAFHPDTGPLTDPTLPKPEREALSALFWGSFGSYRNPCGHRRVAMEVQEAVELIMLSSHLMRLVEVRTAASKT